MEDLQGCYSVIRKNYITVLDIVDMYMPIIKVILDCINMYHRRDTFMDILLILSTS